jgi:3-oxoacyl-[acyl-carrier protein] reductase
MDLGLRDRVYLVTGGSRGLGFAAAQALIADGARVVLSAPHQATAAAAATRLTQHGAAAEVAAWVVADNADPATPGRLIAAAKDRFGRLDGALISVGGTPTGSVSLMPSAAIPIRNVPASPRASRCAGTASPRSSDELPRSCSPRPHPSSRAR